MSIFKKTYTKTIELSAKPAASFYLFLLSFTEASFFIVPPDVMLAPMCLAQPKKNMETHFNRYCWICFRWSAWIFYWYVWI